VVPSASLLVKNDPSLLFINAGMNQFKSVFLGQESRPYKTACSSQKCLRVSGKHNDLENVGVTPRHHTFFEMLGNFSFGDYFKEDAITFAWEFLTKTVGLDPSRLWVTVYTTDDDAEALWRKIAPAVKDRIRRFGEKENFWSMGDVGPCGPCSEIHYDFGTEYSCGNPDCTVNCDCDRFTEIWNLVFMQYVRTPDGKTEPLPKPSVDTGMGLERLATVVQGHHSNYDTDLFMPIISALARDSGKAYDPGPGGVPHRVCADHLRGLVFTIADGGMPGNEGAGYVLRRILRRAVWQGMKLGYKGPFLHRFVGKVIGVMRGAYPELEQRKAHIEHVIETEESGFSETLSSGRPVYVQWRDGATGGTFPAEGVMSLSGTSGIPVEQTEIWANEDGLTLDYQGFEALLAQERARSRASSAFHAARVTFKADLPQSRFDYDKTRLEATLLWASDDQTALVLDQTPFYVESGGQVDDTGWIVAGEDFRFEVEKMENVDRAIVHHGRVTKGDARDWEKKTVTAIVDEPRRLNIQRNHTATHLLHKALRLVLGDHVHQAGSLVDPERLRFDFSHTGPMTAAQIQEVEGKVNQEILANTPVDTKQTDYKRALADGVTALFGEKYGDIVRVVKIGDYSSELCGGTHVSSTGVIGLFRIRAETGVAAGVRRIEAITGKAANEWARDRGVKLEMAALSLKTSAEKVVVRIDENLERIRTLESELAKTRKKLAAGAGQAIQYESIADLNMKFLFHRLADGSADEAVALADHAKTQDDAVVAVVASPSGNLVVTASPEAVKRGAHAGKLLGVVAGRMGGRGGGRPDFAQGKVPSLDAWDSAKDGFLRELRAMVGK